MMEVAGVLARRAIPACAEYAAEPLVCTAAIVRAQMRHPLFPAPLLQGQMPHKTHCAHANITTLSRGRLDRDHAGVRHQDNLSRRPRLPRIFNKQRVHSAEDTQGGLSIVGVALASERAFVAHAFWAFFSSWPMVSARVASTSSTQINRKVPQLVNI